MIKMDPTQKPTEKQMRKDFELIDLDNNGTISMKGNYLKFLLIQRF